MVIKRTELINASGKVAFVVTDGYHATTDTPYEWDTLSYRHGSRVPYLTHENCVSKLDALDYHDMCVEQLECEGWEVHTQMGFD